MYICRVCLRMDKAVGSKDTSLIQFHYELCNEPKEFYRWDPQYCVECEYLLRKMYNFKDKCIKAMNILNYWMNTDQGPPKNLHTFLPQTALGISTPATSKDFHYHEEESTPTNIEIVEPSENMPIHQVLIRPSHEIANLMPNLQTPSVKEKNLISSQTWHEIPVVSNTEVTPIVNLVSNTMQEAMPCMIIPKTEPIEIETQTGLLPSCDRDKIGPLLCLQDLFKTLTKGKTNSEEAIEESIDLGVEICKEEPNSDDATSLTSNDMEIKTEVFDPEYDERERDEIELTFRKRSLESATFSDYESNSTDKPVIDKSEETRIPKSKKHRCKEATSDDSALKSKASEIKKERRFSEERTAYSRTLEKQPDEPEDFTNEPLPSMSETMEVQDTVASTLATPFAQPIIATSKSKAQKQREYRQRIAASRTPAQAAAARKLKNERQRNNRLRQATKLAIASGSLEATATSSSCSGEESNNVQTRSQLQHAQQQSTTTADQPDERVNLTSEPLFPAIPVPMEVQEAVASTSATRFAEAKTVAPKTRAQIQREYRQRIAASKTPAQAAAAREARNARERNNRLCQAANLAIASNSLEATPKSSSRSGQRLNTVHIDTQRQFTDQS